MKCSIVFYLMVRYHGGQFPLSRVEESLGREHNYLWVSKESCGFDGVMVVWSIGGCLDLKLELQKLFHSDSQTLFWVILAFRETMLNWCPLAQNNGSAISWSICKSDSRKKIEIWRTSHHHKKHLELISSFFISLGLTKRKVSRISLSDLR